MADKHYGAVALLLRPEEQATFERPPKKVADSNKESILRRLASHAKPVFSQRNAVEFRQKQKRKRSPDARDVQGNKKGKVSAAAASPLFLQNAASGQ